MNKLDYNDNKYQPNGKVTGEYYKEGIILPFNTFVSFVMYCKPLLFITNIFLPNNIDGICVLHLKLYFIQKTTLPPQKNLVKLCSEVHYMCWGYKSIMIA